MTQDIFFVPGDYNADVQHLPNGIQSLCRYAYSSGPFNYSEFVYLHRKPGEDQLWTSAPEWMEIRHADLIWGIDPDDHYLQAGIMRIRTRRYGSEIEAGQRLLAWWLRSRMFLQNPVMLETLPPCYSKDVLLHDGHFSAIVERMDNDLSKWSTLQPTPEGVIITEARALRIVPWPAGIRPGVCIAHCPAGDHSLWLNGRRERFVCVTCAVKGGMTEFRDFVRSQPGRMKGSDHEA